MSMVQSVTKAQETSADGDHAHKGASENDGWEVLRNIPRNICRCNYII
jgi:hypothetical protein